jgi:membrane associated rhomboid family serine protease
MGGLGGGLTGPVPRDLWLLLGLVFFTFSLQFFALTSWLPALLRLSAAVWQRGFVWQLVTYPFVGIGRPGLWFLVELLILFLFGRDVYLRLGRRRFWKTLLLAGGIAGLVAVAVALVGQLLLGFGPGAANAFLLMQGHRMLLTVLIAAFATLNREATILLFFVLPIRARWFLLLEIVFAFLGFLGTKDFPGFVGLCTAVGFTFGHLTGWQRQAWTKRAELRARQLWLRLRLSWLRRKRGIRVVPRDDDPKGPWVH